MGGFTLLEALIAVVLLGIIGTAAMRSVHFTGQQISAVRYAEDAQHVSSAMLREVLQNKKIPVVSSGSFSVKDGNVDWHLYGTPVVTGGVDVTFVKMDYTLVGGSKKSLSAWFTNSE